MTAQGAPRGWSRILVLGAALLVFTTALSLLPVVRDFELRLADTYFRTAPQPARSNVVLVLIDDESLRQVGRWPWSRTVLAELTRNLSNAGASVIGLDILLSEAQSPDSDRALAATIGKNTVLVDKIGNYPDGPRWTEPIAVFADAAGAIGHAQAPLDRDGLCRRYPPRQVTLEGPRWAFGIEVARRVDASAAAQFLAHYGVPFHEEAGPVSIARPVLVPIAFRDGGFETLSASRVLKGDLVGSVRGRPVMVGFGSSDLADRVMTPVSRELPTPGVEVHAQIFDAVVSGRMLKDESTGGVIILLGATCLAAVLVFTRWRGWLTAIALPALAACIYAIGWELFVRVERVPPIGPMLLAVVAAPIVVHSADLFLVERSVAGQLRELRQWLASRGAMPVDEGSGLPWKLRLLHRLQSQLGALYELHETLLKSSEDLIAIFDSEERLLLANSRFAEVFREDAAAGAPLERLRTRLVPHPEAPLATSAGKTAGEAYVGERLYFVRIVPLPATTLSPEGGALMMLTDLEARVERDRARSEALGFVTHELRTPLVAIQGFAEVMMRYPDSPAKNAAPETIFRESRRLLALINSYLDVLRMDAGARPIATSMVEMGAVVRQVFDILQPLAAANDMRLAYQGSGAMMVLGDEVLLTGAVLNLVSNAIKYGEPGTEVNVHCGPLEGGVIFAVHNRCEPIPAADLVRLGQPFFRRREAEATKPGYGLGVAFVKRIAEAHRGSLTVQNTDHGVRFELHLPAAVAARVARVTP